jgi:hypothetical protein
MSEQQPEPTAEDLAPTFGGRGDYEDQDQTEQLTEQERELLASDDLTPEEVEAIRASQQMPSTPPPDDPDVS